MPVHALGRTRHTTFCRLCSPLCGLVVEVEAGQVVAVKGDPHHPLTAGFTCTKGRHLGELHHRPDRLLQPLRDGVPIDYELAVAEIGTRLTRLIAEHGRDAVALFVGTQSYTASLTHSFMNAWVGGLDELRNAVRPLTPEATAPLCGVAAESIITAAHLFAGARRGMARSGTGPDMGPWSNVAEHMVQVLNVICGRFPRAGDLQLGTSVLDERRAGKAQVLGPRRSWETGPASATGWGPIFGQYPSGTLADEILDGGDRRIRALVVAGGNPMAAFPEPDRIEAALRSLDLLVTIDPYPSATAALADYVIAPALSLERPDHTRGYEHLFSRPFAQWTDAVLPRPAGTVEDWEFFHDLASAMGLTLRIGSNSYDPGGTKPSSSDLLAIAARRSRIPYDDIKGHPSGVIADELDPARVTEPDADTDERFVVMAPDVAAELTAAADAIHVSDAPDTVRLVVRRAKGSINSVAAEPSANPCRLHPSDIERLGLSPGDPITVSTEFGTLDTIVAADATLRQGVASMTHCIDPNPSRLLSLTDHRQSINAMPWITAVPISVRPNDTHG